MKYLRMLTFAALGLAALLIPATASATQLTSPSGTVYTGTVSAQLGSTGLEWHGSFTTITCKTSTIDGTVESHSSSTTTKIGLSSLKFSECNFPFKVLKAGSFEIHTSGASANGNGTVTWSGMELTVETSIANCLFTTSGTDLGTLTGSDTANAILDINSAGIPRTGHSIFCGSSATLTGGYTFTAPSTLTVD
jgi:hypothetical protein